MKRKSKAPVEVQKHRTVISNCIMLHCTDQQIERVKKHLLPEANRCPCPKCGNLAMLVRRLAHRVPNCQLKKQALKFLNKTGLQGSPLRKGEA